MKIVVLVIASRGPAYDRFLENWRAQILPANVSVKYLFCSEDQTDPFEVRGDSIFLKGRECIKPALHHKTLAALSHTLLEPYDYLLRTNLSSYINFRKLEKFLEDKPREFCAAGTYFEGGFLSGSGYILTRDLVKNFLEWCEDTCDMNPMCHHDDEIMGAFIKECGPVFFGMNGITYDTSMPMEDAVEKLHVRFKSSCIEGKRGADIEQHRGVIEYYNLRMSPINSIKHQV
jgi:hypothetical protein